MDSASASAKRRLRFEDETMLSTNVPSDLYWRVTASSYIVNVLLEVVINMGCLRPSIGYETATAIFAYYGSQQLLLSKCILILCMQQSFNNTSTLWH
jgi:hypothetical protein